MLSASSLSFQEQPRSLAVQVKEPCPPTSPMTTSSVWERRPPSMLVLILTPMTAIQMRVCGSSAIKYKMANYRGLKNGTNYYLNRFFQWRN